MSEKVARVFGGIATGGLSEVALAATGKPKTEKIPKPAPIATPDILGEALPLRRRLRKKAGERVDRKSTVKVAQTVARDPSKKNLIGL